eukprot:scaffold16.g151.t1
MLRTEDLKRLAGEDSDEEEKPKESKPEQEPLPEGVTAVTTDRGVLKKVLKEGDGWVRPEKGDKVTVHYVGKLEDGTKFDSSRDRGEPFVFNLGKGQVIQGWDLGVATMKKGERALLTIKSEYGYGEAGSPPKIPGAATLLFEVELLSWLSIKDICGDGGVIKTILKEGSGYERPLENDEACVRITARVEGAGSPAAFYASPVEGETFTVADGIFCRAIREAVKTMRKGEEARLSVAPEYGFGQEGQGSVVPPGARLEVELALLWYKRVEKLSDDGSVVKKILVDIEGFKRPNAGAKVAVAYMGRLADGTVFDERSEKEPLEFTIDEGGWVGEDEVPDGLEMAVLRMNEGEKALLTIGPKYGYGDAGSKQPLAEVPPGATLTYEISLLRMEKAKEVHQMDNEEKKQRSKEIVKSCDLNLAAAYLKLGKWKDVARVASEVLEVENGNLKALYRRATAYIELGDYVEAEMDIKQGLLVEPEAADFKALHRRWKVVAGRGQRKQAAVYGGMFKKAPAGAKAGHGSTAVAPAAEPNGATEAAGGEAVGEE